jgi:hypothetical protein
MVEFAALRTKQVRREEGLAFRSHEHGQRPAASLAHHLDDLLIDVVDGRSLLAVDLDVDEALVHQPRDLWVLEGLVSHHLASVACGVPHRQVNRLILLPSAAERVFSPRIPIHWVLGVLPEVWGGFISQAIHHAHRIRAATCSRSARSSATDRPPDEGARQRARTLAESCSRSTITPSAGLAPSSR